MAKRAELLALAGRIEESRAAWKALIAHLENLPNLERGSNSMSLLAEQARKSLASPDKTDRRNIPIKPDALHEEEIQLMNQHLTTTPDDASIWHQRSLLLLADGEFQQALLDCDEADRLAPGKFPTGYVRSAILLRSGETEKGKAALDEFLGSSPEHVAGIVMRARLALQARQPDAALPDFRKALTANKGAAEIDLVLEVANVMAANGHSSEALAILDSQIVTQGEVPSLIHRAIELETAAGSYDVAISRVDALAKSSPQPEPWLAKQAEILTLAGRPADAREAWLALQNHLASLPNLQRGRPTIMALAQQANAALSRTDSNIPPSPPLQ